MKKCPQSSDSETGSDSEKHSFMLPAPLQMISWETDLVLCVLIVPKIQVLSLSNLPSVLLKLQQLYFWKKKNLNCDLAAAGPSSSVLQLWLELENQHRGTSYISSNKTDKPERMRWSCAFWFCGEREKKINAAWLNFKCRGDWGGGGGGGMLLRMWLYNERTIHRLQLEISWVS